MSKIFVSLILALAVISLTDGNQINDVLNSGIPMNMNGLNILQILMNPKGYLEQKIGELVLKTELSQLAENDPAIDFKVEQVNTMDIAYVHTINADLMDSHNNTANYNITIAIRFLDGVTDFTFNSEGQPPITKQLKLY